MTRNGAGNTLQAGPPRSLRTASDGYTWAMQKLSKSRPTLLPKLLSNLLPKPLHAHALPWSSTWSASAIQACILGLGLILTALPAQAQWKWRDASGRMQISDLPPPNGTPEKDILQRPAGFRPLPVLVVPYASKAEAASAAAATAASAASKAELDRQAKQREQGKQLDKQKENEALEKQKQEERRVAEQRRDNCGRAQESLRTLQDGQRLARRNERGENIIMDDKARAEEIQRTRNIISSECS